jgi:F420-dependent oxidoreductase-like protein
MRIGLTGFGTTVEQVVRQVERAEADGFASVWHPSAVAGDPLAALAIAGRATSTIELGTSVLVTYACHPVLQAYRAAAVASAIGSPGRFTLGVGPSHQPVVEGMLGLAYDAPGRHTEDYVATLAALLRGEAVASGNGQPGVNAGPPPTLGDGTVPVLLGALGPRLLRVAGQHASGTITWMANAAAVADHVAPRIRAAAADAGRPEPRIVVGLPVAVHDDVAAAREVAAQQFTVYGTLPNYQRILAAGGVAGPADAAIVGDEAAVTEQIEALFEAGATDVWAAPFPVGDDASGSRARTRALLVELARS